MKNLVYIFIIMILVWSCNNQVADDHGHDHSGHSHGEVKLQLTQYSDQFEVFAEADPFSIDNQSIILAHFSHIPDFTPLAKGNVTIKMIVGKAGIKQTIEKPLRPGIYEFALTPKVPGKAKIIFEIETKDGIQKLTVDDLTVYADEHEAIHIADENHEENPNAIAFTKEQSWKINFKTEFPSVKPFGQVIKATAQVLPTLNNEMIITAKTNGVVHFSKNVLEGDDVKTGASLMQISGSGLANENAHVRYTEAKNNYELAKSDYDRKLALSKQQIVSTKELEVSKTDFENAKTIYENLKQHFNANGQNVFASKGGNIKHVFVQNGQYVEAGEQLVSIVANDRLIVKAEVQQKHFPILSSIYSANFKSQISGKVYELKDLNGKFLSYGKSIDEDEGYLIPVNFEIDSKNFLAGSFVETYIKTETNQAALLVPNEALIEEQANFFVFVQLTPESFEKREVKIGKTDGINTEILSGITKDERIVSKGAIIVKLAAVSNSLDPHAGHVH